MRTKCVLCFKSSGSFVCQRYAASRRTRNLRLASCARAAKQGTAAAQQERHNPHDIVCTMSLHTCVSTLLLASISVSMSRSRRRDCSSACSCTSSLPSMPICGRRWLSISDCVSEPCSQWPMCIRSPRMTEHQLVGQEHQLSDQCVPCKHRQHTHLNYSGTHTHSSAAPQYGSRVLQTLHQHTHIRYHMYSITPCAPCRPCPA